MRRSNNELQCCDEQSTAVVYFEAGLLASTIEIEANPRSPLLDINTDNQMITAEQNENRGGYLRVFVVTWKQLLHCLIETGNDNVEKHPSAAYCARNLFHLCSIYKLDGTYFSDTKNFFKCNFNRSQSNNNVYTNNVEELEAKVSMLEMENYELKAKLRENQHFIRRNSQMKQDVQKKYEELSSELYKAYLELQKVRSELAHSKSMQNDDDGHHAEKRQTENMDNMVREIDALKASLDRETSRADWYHGEVEYFRRRVQELENEIQRRSSEHAQNDSVFRECDRLQAQLHDMTNKAKWYEGEKEYFKREMENYSSRCAELDKYNCTIKNIINEALIVRKDPYYDRQKWNLAQVSSNENKQFRHVIFKYACATAHQVYLTASFYNWECAILMNKQDDGIWSIGIDVPLGRHEFRFLQLQNCDCSSQHPTCYNDYGSMNNWIMVE
ncbi:hypothetical protein T06_13991 [Trichinella sp. T6]|nr:hypothetical protein T06_13991 [Trichinella sp. T6]